MTKLPLVNVITPGHAGGEGDSLAGRGSGNRPPQGART